MRLFKCVSLCFGLALILSAQIQQPANQNTRTFRAVPGGVSVKAIAAAKGRSLALALGYRLGMGRGCWPIGMDYPFAPVLELSRPVPTRVSGLRNMVGVASSYEIKLALKQDGTVWACGSDPSCGRTTAWATPVEVSGLSGVLAIAARMSAQ